MFLREGEELLGVQMASLQEQEDSKGDWTLGVRCKSSGIPSGAIYLHSRRTFGLMMY